jgi:hypothetical protein
MACLESRPHGLVERSGLAKKTTHPRPRSMRGSQLNLMNSILETKPKYKPLSQNAIDRRTAIDCGVQLHGMPDLKILKAKAKAGSDYVEVSDMCSRKHCECVATSHRNLTDFLPDAFRYKGCRPKAEKWARLFKRIKGTKLAPYHYVICLGSIGLKQFERSTFIYDVLAILAIKAAINEMIQGPFHASLEVGTDWKLHVHVIARQQDQALLERGLIDWGGHIDTEDYEKKLTTYLCKPKVKAHLALIGKHIIIQEVASSLGRTLPRTVWTRQLGNSKSR